MILLEIKDYMQQYRVANLEQLAVHFKRDVSLMEQMLNHWIRKGVIQEIEKPNACGSRCQSCRPEWARMYQYVGQKKGWTMGLEPTTTGVTVRGSTN